MSPIVEQPGFRFLVDGPDRVHHDGDAAIACKQSLHGAPHAVIGGHAVDDEGRIV